MGPIWIKSGSSIKTNFKMQVIISKYKKMGPIWIRKGLSSNTNFINVGDYQKHKKIELNARKCYLFVKRQKLT